MKTDIDEHIKKVNSFPPSFAPDDAYLSLSEVTV